MPAEARCVVYELKPAGPVHPPAFRPVAARRSKSDWRGGELLANALEYCCTCRGFGWKNTGRRPTESPASAPPCACVERAICRAVLRQVRITQVESSRGMTRVYRDPLEPSSHNRGNRFVYSRRREEFLADVMLIAERALDELHHRVFQRHLLEGADWRTCTRELGIDKGTFFHAVYRAERLLGRAFRDTEPYALWPVDQYFAQQIRTLAA